MKTLLKTVLALQIISIIIVFMGLIGTSPFYAVIASAISAVQLAPTIAIMMHTRDIDDLYDEVNRLRYEIKKLDRDMEALHPDSDLPDRPADPSFGTWECVKCGAVNKSGTSKCENCGAKYSFVQNPTTDPEDKKKAKVSRWVK
ncbi:MAG: zinc finger Ran-binding domain-containing family 2 protein [Clostridia bacterium]|nr:zinc finger Ran-binding domain-containing family 2 protein [Clostridia bacterium]